jgi:hypothetical protein
LSPDPAAAFCPLGHLGHCHAARNYERCLNSPSDAAFWTSEPGARGSAVLLRTIKEVCTTVSWGGAAGFVMRRNATSTAAVPIRTGSCRTVVRSTAVRCAMVASSKPVSEMSSGARTRSLPHQLQKSGGRLVVGGDQGSGELRSLEEGSRNRRPGFLEVIPGGVVARRRDHIRRQSEPLHRPGVAAPTQRRHRHGRRVEEAILWWPRPGRGRPCRRCPCHRPIAPRRTWSRSG